MKLVILGATGKTGTALLGQALDAGHDVTAVVRNAAGITAQSPRLKVFEGNLFRVDDLERAFAGQDAVLSALGAKSLGQTTIYSEPIRRAVDAMRTQGVNRLICISSAGLEERDPSFGFFYRVFLKGMLLRNSYADMARMEEFLRTVADVGWIIVRPTVLTDGPASGHYRVSPRLCPPGKGPHISRADVAHFMLGQVGPSEHLHQTPTLAY